MAAQALLCAQQQGMSGDFLVHRKELIDQTSTSFEHMGVPHSFVAAKRPYDPTAATLLAGVQTLVNRLDVVLPPNLLIADECHHSVSATWSRVFDANPDAFILGFTATPERLDGKGLDQHFDIMLVGPSPGELIARGFLSPFDYYAPSLPDFSGVRTEQHAEAIMDRPELIGNMVEHYLRLAKGQSGLLFAHSIQHSKDLVDAFNAEGVRAAHMDGDMSDTERERVDAMLRNRDIDLMSSVALVGEGYDVPDVVYCGIGRRTQSLGWFKQMAGRVLRPVYADGWNIDTDAARLAAIAAGPKPRAVIADHAANVFTHGFPDDEVEWSLEGRSARARTGVNDDADPVRQCLGCFRVYPSTAKACPGCGATQSTTPREIKQREGELQKLERESLRAEQEAAKKRAAAARKAEEKACTSEADFRELAVRRGYDNPRAWAARQVGMRAQYAQRFRR
jgi:superfamily II DNA or RNA helicase